MLAILWVYDRAYFYLLAYIYLLLFIRHHYKFIALKIVYSNVCVIAIVLVKNIANKSKCEPNIKNAIKK